MGKVKSEASRIAEGRCLKNGENYIGFIKANEARSTATAMQIYDPVAKRMVDVLSPGEEKVFYDFRYMDDVYEIQEQYALLSETVNAICEKYHFRKRTKKLTTDFLVTYKNGCRHAFSVKPSRKIFLHDVYQSRRGQEKYEKLLIRQFIEKKYWEHYGIPFTIVFSDEIPRYLVSNLRSIYACYDRRDVVTTDQKYRYLLAHKVIKKELSSEYIPFGEIARQYKDDIEALFQNEMKKLGTNGSLVPQKEERT